MPDQTITVPTAALDVSVTYKGNPLNNTTVEFFVSNGSLDTGTIPLGDTGQKKILVTLTAENVTLRLARTPLAPEEDPSIYPVLGGDYPLGPVAGNTRVLIVVAPPLP